MSHLTDFERLALPHMGAAYNLAFWLVRSQSDAQDIVQESALAVLPTGWGMSPSYQIALLIRPGVGLVVSPLIALMADQMSALRTGTRLHSFVVHAEFVDRRRSGP
jgi:hypothetical protein